MRPSQNSAKRRMISMTTKTAKSNNHAPASVKEHMAAKDHAAKDHGKDRTKKSEAGPKNESEVLLANALGQIEKTFGKGSIMKLTEATSPAIQGHLQRRPLARSRFGRSRLPPRTHHRALRPRVERQDDPGARTRSPAPSTKGASPPSSTPSTRSTRRGPSGWASIWKSCSSASPLTAKRHCRSPRC